MPRRQLLRTVIKRRTFGPMPKLVSNAMSTTRSVHMPGVGIVTGAGFSTAVDSPKEWGRTWDGFGKRVASNFGRNAIRSTAIYALDESLKLDSHFYQSEKRDVGSRVANAFVSTVTARKPSGKRVLGVPRIAATYTSDVIASELWYPARYDWKDGMRNGTISSGSIRWSICFANSF